MRKHCCLHQSLTSDFVSGGKTEHFAELNYCSHVTSIPTATGIVSLTSLSLLQFPFLISFLSVSLSFLTRTQIPCIFSKSFEPGIFYCPFPAISPPSDPTPICPAHPHLPWQAQVFPPHLQQQLLFNTALKKTPVLTCNACFHFTC